MYWWISWHQPTDDRRPLTSPPNGSILGWWGTGYDSGDNATLCAMVRAESEEAARTAVLADWPEAERWRFCEARDSVEIGDRFVPHDWMIERFDAERSRLAAKEQP